MKSFLICKHDDFAKIYTDGIEVGTIGNDGNFTKKEGTTEQVVKGVNDAFEIAGKLLSMYRQEQEESHAK